MTLLWGWGGGGGGGLLLSYTDQNAKVYKGKEMSMAHRNV